MYGHYDTFFVIPDKHNITKYFSMVLNNWYIVVIFIQYKHLFRNVTDNRFLEGSLLVVRFIFLFCLYCF